MDVTAAIAAGETAGQLLAMVAALYAGVAALIGLKKSTSY